MPEAALTSGGYRVLTQAKDAGVDTFIKQQQSLFVFFQGHPEYQSDTLLREYRRDIGRYFKGDTDTYPPIPRTYFDEQTTNELGRLQERALGDRSGTLLSEISSALGKKEIENTWSASATAIYKNWLMYICEQKEKTLRSGNIKAAANAGRAHGQRFA